MPVSTIPVHLLNRMSNHRTSRWSSLARIPPESYEIEEKEVGRRRFELLTPAMSRLNGLSESDRSNSGGGRWSNSLPSPAIDWRQFHQYLRLRMTAKTAEDRLRYARQYVHVLVSSRIREDTGNELLQLSPNKRIHVQKALSSLARFTGQYSHWQAIIQQYQLSWSTGTEKLDAFARFFDDSKSLDVMMEWLREALRSLPYSQANFYLFCALTGLRASEAVEAVRLLNGVYAQGIDYYNPSRQILQHYLFPDIFIRRTKACYISIVNDDIVKLLNNIRKIPTLDGLKMATRHRSLSMRLKYCRKIFASYLHKNGISDSLIDMLQGRIGKNIFVKHYLTLPTGYKDNVLSVLSRLKQEIER